MERRFSIRLKDEKLIKFVNLQSNLTDTIRYLLEKEISQNGIRDLQQIIPSKRTNKYLNGEEVNNE